MSRGCSITRVEVKGDIDGRLKRAAEAVANGEKQKLVILAGYLGSQEFLDYCKSDALYNSDKSLAENHLNIVRRLLRSYYLMKNKNAYDRRTKEQAESLIGFGSATAKALSLSWSASLILNTHYKNNVLAKRNNQKFNRVDVIREVIDEIRHEYIQNCIKPLISSIGENDLVNRFNDSLNKVNELIESEEYEGIYDDYDNALNQLMSDAYELIEEYGNPTQKNFRALAEQAHSNPVEWFTKVFDNPRLVNLVNSYQHALESDKLYESNYEDDNDYVNDDADDTDEMSKSWEDKEWASFNKAVSQDLKIYFASLYKLSAPAELNDTDLSFYTDNEVGVPETMGANFIIQQLLNNISNFNSVEEFIDDIVKISHQIPECYGLIQIAQRANRDPKFANELFVNLGNPKIIKTQIVILENGIDVTQSNKSADALTYTIFQMINRATSIAKYNFDNKDIDVLKNWISKVNSHKDDFYSKRENNDKLLNDIYDVLNKYYPNLTFSVLENALIKTYPNSNKTTKDKLLALLKNATNFLIEVEKISISRNELLSEHNKARSAWAKKRYEAILSDDTFDQPAPVINWESLDTSGINQYAISIADQLVRYTAVQNSLNSVNAEGNLTSDITYNNYITNLLKQINYGTDEESNAGLKTLLEEVQKGEQYRYNTLFWGVQDENGKYISDGLFKRVNGKAIINDNAKQILNVSLFNGSRLFDNSKAVMYSKMSKGDYFFTAMLAYFNPQKSGTHLTTKYSELNDKYAGYLMRTPSDAPKNFIIQAPKFNSKNILTPIRQDIDNYIKHKTSQINKLLNKTNVYEDWETENILSLPKYNIWTAANIYNLLSGELDTINYNGMKVITNNDGSISIPIVHKTNNATEIIWVRGQKVIEETNNILIDFTVETITPSLGYNTISYDFIQSISDILTQEGIANGSIKTIVNTNVEIFKAIRQQLLGELNTFIDQLNNLFIKDKKGNWRLRKDTLNLIDRAHYNESLIKDGKLTGNFFKFKKLFNTNDINMQEEIERMFSLYGGGVNDLIKVTQSTATININQGLVKEVDGVLTLNIADETLNDKLTELTSLWINNFNREVVEKSKQFNKLLENNEQYDVLDFALNYANSYMSFDDVFEGDVKFYKDAQDFLKRAKEVQAGGSLYTGYNITDAMSSEIKDVTRKDGSVYKIKIGDISLEQFINAYLPVEGNGSSNARNGFRAITIYNTVRPSKYADKIEEEIYNILRNKMSNVEAKRIAVQISKGYRDNTKTNDAQSYITLEEFIRRRYADGTLSQYEDILTQIYEVRTGKRDYKDLDLAGINARIQVQKNFYFDKHFDKVTKTFYPRQIKNAEFVIIPELVQGTDLEQLYNIMTKYDIGQVNTAEASKAAKRNVLTFWDNDGNINIEEFEKTVNANGQTAIENYYYRYLYKQQEVPEHMKDQANKAGIQIMKKILDNADESVKPYIKQFFDNYCANIKDDFNRLLFNMGWKTDSNGNLVNIDGSKQTLDFTEFYKRARREAQRLGLDENFIDYLTVDEFGDPIMPNYMNNVTSKLESIAQALFNRVITRQTLPGWHAAQVTQVGHGSKVLDSNGKFRELRYHPAKEDGSGNEAYAEVLIPRWSNLIPKDYSFEKLEKEGLDIQIAYRIPTEGKQSISKIKVVGFLDDVYGSTIMLPDEWVTQTGADFDIDSVYAISHQIRKDRKTGDIVKWSDETLKTDSAKYFKYLYDRIKDKTSFEIDDELNPNIYKQYLTELTTAFRANDDKAMSKIGKAVGLYSFKEFEALDELDKQPREVRNNNILDAMIAIMDSDNSREENYSRSNFDNITNVMKHCNSLRGSSSLDRSSYNIFDQIDFFENATSGAALKAFSVTRDTFNSLNNICKSTLSSDHTIKVKYNLKEYSLETLQEAYGKDVDTKSNPGYAIVTHRRLGHSLNNRNVRGQLVTVYSSQTTAHILDAIKEGAIYNENMYTFGTFKTLIDLGIDYDTAIPFLMQPAITRINEVNNETNSIYLNAGGNAIKVAIKRIAANAGFIVNGNIINDYTNYEDVLKVLSNNDSFKKAIKELFGAELSEKNTLDRLEVVLDKTMLENRLKSVEIINNSELSDKDKQIQNVAFDIAIALMFNKMHNTTNNIEKIMRCTNPDKFGAKQTVRSTRTIIRNIEQYGWDESDDVTKTISSNNKPLLQALYPGFDKGNINVLESSYPYLAAFMKYATIPSVNINSVLFPTENEQYTLITDAVQRKMGIVFTDEQYKEYKQYMMADVYTGIEPLYTPTKISKEGWFIEDIDRISEHSNNNINYWDAERSRIFGYEETESLSLEIKDIDNPTEEELNVWYKFTPAQKIMWLSMNIDVAKSIFKYLEIDLNNQRQLNQKGYAQQNIRFTDAAELLEEVYLAFNNTAYNKNVLIRSAIYDLVKYAFIVESYKFKKGGLSKIITNKFLYNGLEELGTNIIPLIRQQFSVYANEKDGATERFIDRFVRSHSEYVRTIKLDRASNVNNNPNIAFKLNIYGQGDGLIYIPFEKRAEDVLELLRTSSDDENGINGYIRVNKLIGKNNRKITLYKIRKTNSGVYLIPLNLLERNEVTDYSVNKENNKYYDYPYYNTLINAAEQNNETVKLVKTNNRLDIEALKSDNIIPIFKTTRKTIIDDIDYIDRISIYGKPYEIAAINNFINKIIPIVNSPVEGTNNIIYSADINIGKLIPIGTDSIQKININGEKVYVNIKALRKAPNNTIREKAKKDGMEFARYYRITPVIEKEVADKDSIEEAAHKERISKEMNAITSDLSEYISEEADTLDVVDTTLVQLLNEVKRAERNGDENAATLRKNLQLRQINENRFQDLIDHRKNIYESLAQYIEVRARNLNNLIDNYEFEENTYNLGQKELYEALRSNHNEAELIIKLLLEAITFADTFGNVMSLPFDGLDDDTKRAIQRIRNAIVSVRSNRHVKAGFDLMFNHYIANEYSTNPNVRLGLVNLKDAFGDAGWFETNIGDPAMVSNKQIQTIISIVNSILTKATEIDAPKQKREFLKKVSDIESRSGTFSWNNIIDEQGRLRRPYTDKFIEDRNKLNENIQFTKEVYGENSLEHIKAKLERDEWYAKNVHQIVVPEYYNKKNALIRTVIANAPTEYVEYIKLQKELYGNKKLGLLTEEERIRRKDIQKKINQLISEYKGTEELKDDDERFRANQLRIFIHDYKALNNEYFEFNEALGFRETLEIYLRVIENYENAHPNMPLIQRLDNEEYREAYEWIKNNSYYSIDKDAREALNKAYKILSVNDAPESNKSTRIKAILDKANAYDIFGNIDPTKLTDEDIREIKEITESKYTNKYDSNAGDAILIKDIPANLPVLKDEFYRMLRDPSENETGVNPRRLRLIKEINDTLRKVVDKNGRIRSKLVFENLTEDERFQLIRNYAELNSIKGKRKPKEIRKRFAKNVDFLTNDEAFNEELSYALTHFKGTADWNIWVQIFADIDEDTGEIKANNNLYGYIQPKDNIYVDEEKTAARKLIEDNVEFVPTQYYFDEIRRQTANGTYNEWFNNNHVYNPYTHKYEPLRIWTTEHVNPTGSLKGSYSYIPTNEYAERTVKEEYANPNYNKSPMNYNVEGGSEYFNKLSLTEKEKDMLDLLEQTMEFFRKYNHNNRRFIEEGFVPRKYYQKIDSEFYVKQALGIVGLEWRNDSEDRYYDKVDYVNDRELSNNMLQFLKGKGYQKLEQIRTRSFGESEEDYKKYVDEVKKKNEEIRQNNIKIDNSLMNRDFKTVFAEALEQQIILNAQSKAKNWLYLLQEDLKNNEAYKVSPLTGNLIKDKRNSTDEYDEFNMVPQNNSLEIVHTFTRRVIYGQFKQKTKLNKAADLLRNITSAKYMILNVTGGIANIGTGFVNIMGEAFAGMNFDTKDIASAVGMYMNNSISMISDMYSDSTKNFAVGLTKFFNVVDFDAMSERVAGEGAGEYVRRVRNALYGLQSGGEHFMQNSVLFAVLMQNRLFNDVDGTTRCGNFQEYIWKTEWDTLVSIIGNDDQLFNTFKKFVANIKFDKQESYQYDTFRKDVVEMFLRGHCSKDIQQKYITAKKKAIKDAEQRWKTLPKAIDQLQLNKDGYIEIKPDSDFNEDMFINLRKKVIGVNKYIHGVYDKIGAARIEFNWWGGLVMQYHKHLYPGIMKRFRTRGYYDEQTKTINVGSYVAVGRLLSKEFVGLFDKTSGEERDVLSSIHAVAKALLDTVLNIKTNWNLMPEWERKAAKRALGDLYGIISSMLMAIGIYAMTDDDDEENSELVATAIYLADRLLSESQLYTPWGLISETSTLMSSPIAATNSIEDLFKGLGFLGQWMFDEDFDPNYKTGLYAGQNKGAVLIKRNIPAYRVYERLSTMTKNNNYYRINEKALNLRLAKNIADVVNPD